METVPYAIAVGDFNGDGIQDLATVDNYSNNVTVLLGNGSGGFTAAPGSPFPAGSAPSALAVADFNGDGIPDLAAPNFGTNSVTVLFGDGLGGFNVSASFAAGPGPLSVAAGDFNGDGVPDLVAANTNSSALTVLLGDGAGEFKASPESPVSVPGSPRLIAVADFNGDGVQDLAVADAFDGVTVLLGDGTGGFMATAGSPFYTGVGSLPCSILAGDLNGTAIWMLPSAIGARTAYLSCGGKVRAGFSPRSGLLQIPMEAPAWRRGTSMGTAGWMLRTRTP